MQNLLPNLLQDLRYAARQLMKSPGFTITAVLTLAIGIGANIGIFSVMDAVVFRPLAVPDLDHVVIVNEQQNHGDQMQVALANFQDWQRQSRSFESMAVRSSVDMSLTGAGDAAHVQAQLTSPSFFTVLRTNAFLGRVFDQSETQPGRDGVAVLTFGFWKDHFGSDPRILGRKIELDQHTYTVVGIMPKTMQYPSTADVFLPFAPSAAQLANRVAHDYLVIGRLRSGVTVAQAQSEMNVVAERLSRQNPATNLGWTVKVEPLLDGINGDLTPLYFSLVLGATGFVLLVVCANVANLQFARGIARRPEIAMRTALGASRMRILRQLLTENILLGIVSAAAGLLVARVYLNLSLVAMPPKVAKYMAGWSNISLNGRAMVLSLLLAVAAGIVAGFAPALQALRMNLVDQLKSGSRSIAGAGRGRWLRNLFAIAQISLAVALVVGAALMSKGMMAVTHASDRYNPAQTLVFGVHLPPARYDTPQKLAAWYSQSLEKLQALPGVKHAELTSALPNSDWAWLDDCLIENRPLAPGKFQSALRLTVSPDYLAAFGIPVVSGRGFNQGDNLASQPVAVVSRRFADRYFPGENPIGHRIRMGGQPKDQTPWLTIVGVSAEASYTTFLRVDAGAVYMNTAQLPRPDSTYAVIVDGDPLAIAPAVRKALAGLDAALPLDDVESFAQFNHEKLVGLEYVAVMLVADALIALLLAAIGIFGVMANMVGERTREIGVRLAMGARREDVLRMILRRASILTGTGLALGLVMAVGLAHGVANLLYGVSPDDPLVFGSITASIAAIALLASWIPAHRAAAVDPMVALRDE
jgi:putative ABC transport system permease protein